MANKRIIELQERTQLDMNDWLIVDSSTSTRKLSMSTLFAYMTMTSMVFVTELPTEDISTSTIYLLPHTGSSTQWDEYIYRDNEWVIIGTSTIDLSALYQTKAAATVQDNNIHWYGTSSTAAATTAKVATTAAGNLGALAAGQKVSIKFTNANTALDPTLNVDNKGAHAIKAYGTTAPTVWWKAGDVVTFTYDGTNWIMGATQGEIEQINTSLSVIGGTITESDSQTAVADNLFVAIVNPQNIPAGTYIVHGWVNFAASDTVGSRSVRFASSTYNGKEIEVSPNQSGYTQLMIDDIVTFDNVANTFSLQAKQTSGNTMNISGQIKLIRIK